MIAGWNDPENIKISKPWHRLQGPTVWRALLWFGFTFRFTWTHAALAHTQTITIMTTSQDIPEQWLSAHDPATCTRKGLCPVAKSKDQGQSLESHSLYFELHGTGPTKVVFISGQAFCLLGFSSRRLNNASRLNVSSNMWAIQVKYLSQNPQYSILVFDNRGVGNSETPRGPYSSVLSSVAQFD